MDDRIRCVSTIDETGRVVQVFGEVDLSTAPELEQSLADLDGVAVTIDLAEVPFMDSSGLHVLVRAHRRVLEHGGTFRLTGLQSSIRRVFEITGLDEHFDVG